MESIYQHFILELWPMWIGLLVALLYWIVRDYIQLRQLRSDFTNFKKDLTKFKNDLNDWIGLRSYESRYFDLKGKIKTYIREELEKINKP
ncbi:MAG: hypothetical protein JRC89_10050 [Deltaproteobacteria bacterium]|nr:hypothetical protein [Deltaproteobacteria bacterium]